ncbi:MAG: (Fe-S)-binding protein [Proteobacteria bacterium]|nr:(Fe-S)-binding protein [Pseudomonadota bacterium]
MSDMIRLARLMEELDKMLAVCMRCGTCQAVCPLFSVTRKESDVARGKLAILNGLLNNMFENPDGVFEHLNRCLLCGSCAANCPSGVKVLDIFIKARAILTAFMGLSTGKKLILRKMLSNPKTFDRLLEFGTKFQGFFTKTASDIVGTSCSRVSSPALKQRHFVPLAPVPFHRSTPSVNTFPGRSGMKIAYFTGCLIDKFFPNVAQAAMDVFSFHEVGVFMPQGQGCCGIPAISAGDTKSFEKLLLYNINQFEPFDFDYLITSCATCTATIKNIWPLMARESLGNDIIKKVEIISKKVLDINQFIVSKIGIKKEKYENAGDSKIITYHDPCHLKKSLGVFEEPRKVIKANSHYTFKEMPEADWCCGMGGSFNIEHYDISTVIGERKRNNIKASGCSIVATSCPACMIQISDMLSKSKDRIEVKHTIEVYAEILKGHF